VKDCDDKIFSAQISLATFPQFFRATVIGMTLTSFPTKTTKRGTRYGLPANYWIKM